MCRHVKRAETEAVSWTVGDVLHTCYDARAIDANSRSPAESKVHDLHKDRRDHAAGDPHWPAHGMHVLPDTDCRTVFIRRPSTHHRRPSNFAIRVDQQAPITVISGH